MITKQQTSVRSVELWLAGKRSDKILPLKVGAEQAASRTNGQPQLADPTRRSASRSASRHGSNGLAKTKFVLNKVAAFGEWTGGSHSVAWNPRIRTLRESESEFNCSSAVSADAVEPQDPATIATADSSAGAEMPEPP